MCMAVLGGGGLVDLVDCGTVRRSDLVVSMCVYVFICFDGINLRVFTCDGEAVFVDGLLLG